MGMPFSNVSAVTSSLTILMKQMRIIDHLIVWTMLIQAGEGAQ